MAGLEPGEYLVDDSGKVVHKVERNFPATLRADPSKLGPAEKVKGALAVPDNKEYRTWHKIAETNGPPGNYLVNEQGVPVYYVDPGINGTHRHCARRFAVTKYDAPKATLMSYIIKGILNRQLPWGLVLLGVMIAIVLEMSGIPSLAFAVGVYLPLSSSSPIFIGGMIRWLVDKYLREKFKSKKLTEEEFVAETDKSPGVLMASGYIAGGALAAVFIAFFAGLWKEQQRSNRALVHGSQSVLRRAVGRPAVVDAFPRTDGSSLSCGTRSCPGAETLHGKLTHFCVNLYS